MGRYDLAIPHHTEPLNPLSSLQAIFQWFHAPRGEVWVRDMALLIAGSLVAYLPGWFTARIIRKRKDSLGLERSRALDLGVKFLEVFL